MTFDEKSDTLLRFIRVESKGRLRPRFTIDELHKAIIDPEIGINLAGDEINMDTLDILSYKITAKGVLTDGYVSVKKSEALAKEIHDRNENLLSRGTIVLAILTGGLLLIELLKFLIYYLV